MYYANHADLRFAVHASPSCVFEQFSAVRILLAPIDLDADSAFAGRVHRQWACSKRSSKRR